MPDSKKMSTQTKTDNVSEKHWVSLKALPVAKAKELSGGAGQHRLFDC